MVEWMDRWMDTYKHIHTCSHTCSHTCVRRSEIAVTKSSLFCRINLGFNGLNTTNYASVLILKPLCIWNKCISHRVGTIALHVVLVERNGILDLRGGWGGEWRNNGRERWVWTATCKYIHCIGCPSAISERYVNMDRTKTDRWDSECRAWRCDLLKLHMTLSLLCLFCFLGMTTVASNQTRLQRITYEHFNSTLYLLASQAVLPPSHLTPPAASSTLNSFVYLFTLWRVLCL